jgi:tetratricopeptide (TPR) repeat protein
MDEEWPQAIRMMSRYFYWEDDPDQNSYLVMSAAYAATEDYRNGLVWVQRAIQHSREPRENLYQIWLYMNSELQDYEAAADVLRQIISLWPANVTYWEQLAGMYMELNRDADALAVLSMAYQRGLLNDERKLMSVVQMYRYREAPYSAARILQRALDNGVVESTEERWEMLSQSYQAAEEVENAIRALQRAAALSNSGELFVREAQLHAMTDNWAGVRTAIRNALDKGRLQNPGRAYMMLGIAAFEDGQHQQSLEAFRGALQHSDSRTRATQWINYVNNYVRTQRALRQGL